MQCELCGTDTDLVKALVEGIQLSVCKNCVKYGKQLRPLGSGFPSSGQRRGPGGSNAGHGAGKYSSPVQSKAQREIVEYVASDCGAMIKKKRENLGLKQLDLALKINEKESLLHNIESGHFLPSLDLARKLEKFLHIKIVEQHEEVAGVAQRSKNGPVTLGDLVKIKKR